MGEKEPLSKVNFIFIQFMIPLGFIEVFEDIKFELKLKLVLIAKIYRLLDDFNLAGQSKA